VFVALLLCAAWAIGDATPDQVLVLYNADWTEDLDGTEPGQDSLEVARYYVEQHTDPKTGQRPYLLGLHCKDPKAARLNEMRLPERSKDNALGLRFVGKSTPVKELPWSATYIVAFRPDELKLLDPKSLLIKASAAGQEEDAQIIYADGAAKPGFDIRETRNPLLVGYGFPRRSAFPDGFTAWVKAQTRDGKPLRDYSARFYHPDQLEADPTGPDGIRDDASYLDDIENPIKAFLEDPKNRLPDGTPLKDHILYFVVCYGLPKQVESSYGVLRGLASGAGGDLGDGSALEERLAILYFSLASRHRPVLFPAPHGKVPHVLIINGLRPSLSGMNPYRHPATHSRRQEARGVGRGLPNPPLYPSYDYDAPRIPHFTAAARRRFGDRFLYFASRIDARHPEIAKAQVDGALYGSRYLTPELGWFWSGTYAAARQGAAELRYFEFRGQPPAKPQPLEVGRCLFYFGDFGYSTAYAEDPAKPPVPYTRGFYPGSVAWAVRSLLGWDLHRSVSQFYDVGSRYPERMIEAGATVCALSAHGAHDTSVTWPDEQVFFHHLLRGYDLGECFLMSTVYLDWLLSFVGDPLYKPDLRRTVRDEAPPRVAAASDIAIEVQPADGRYWARFRPKLATTPDNPEMTDIAVACWRSPDARQTASDWRFSRRPAAVLTALEPDATYHYDLVLTDPYGNAFSSAKALGDLTFRTGPPPPAKRVLLDVRLRPTPGIAAGLDVNMDDPDPAKRKLLLDRGELHVEFTPQGSGAIELVSDASFQFRVAAGAFVVGGGVAAACAPPGERPPAIFTEGRRYKLIARWRRDPVVRQIVLVARDGREFPLGSNNRLAWLPSRPRGPLRALNNHCVIHSVTIYDDTPPQPLDPLYPSHFDLERFESANTAEK